MILTLIVCSIGVVAAVYLIAVMTLRAIDVRIATEKQKILDLAKAYFEPAGPDQPSEFAGFIQVASDILARSITAQLKATFMGIQSKAAQAERAIQGDLLQDTVNMANPLLGAVMNSFPSVGKRLRKNPELWPLIEQFLAKGVRTPAAGGPGSGPAPSNGSAAKFKI